VTGLSGPPGDPAPAPERPAAASRRSDEDRPDLVRRSVVLETTVRLVFHTVLVFSLYLLFAGHNQPGGGFVGGLVAGCAFVLRYIAGGRRVLREVVPVDPRLPLGGGLLLAAGTGCIALLVGGDFLESAKVTLDLPVLGELKASSVLVFDTGVYLVVVGLVLGVLRTLGAEAER
jgi:multicomponent Na+:H+ antiporter subunit A